MMCAPHLGVSRRWGDWACRSRRAFTLVELLAVLFIITLLLLILAPVMGSARETALNALCQNNLEKLSTALRTVSSSTGKDYATMPEAGDWIAAASGGGGKTVLKCPKGYYKGGAGMFPVPNCVKIDPPMSVVYDDLEHNKDIHAFVERVGYKLPRAVTCDIGVAGFYDKKFGDNPKTIPAGTVVNIYFVHYDRVGRSGTIESSGSVSFNGEILGIIVTDERLNGSDDLGYPGTTYATGQRSRGYENNAERIELTDDMRSVIIHRYRISHPGEDLRVITKSTVEASYGMNNRVDRKVPKPSQLLLLEYNKEEADYDREGRGDDDYEVEIAPRHFGRVNTLLVNGAVKLRWPDDLDPTKDENKTLWEP